MRVLFVLLLFVSLFIVSANVLAQGMHSVRVDDTVIAGNEVSGQIVLPEQTADWRVRVVMPEIGVFTSRDLMNSREGRMQLYVPEGTPRGMYVVRTSIKSRTPEGKRMVRHRFVSVE